MADKCHDCEKWEPIEELENWGDGNGDSWIHKSCHEKNLKEFREHLDRCSEEIQKWPEWKKNLFGGAFPKRIEKPKPEQWMQDVMDDCSLRVHLDEKLKKYIRKGMIDFIPVYPDGREGVASKIEDIFEDLVES